MALSPFLDSFPTKAVPFTLSPPLIPLSFLRADLQKPSLVVALFPPYQLARMHPLHAPLPLLFCLQLAVEDHHWWWRSFLCGGATGIFVYGYCFYYYCCRSDMSGFMQVWCAQVLLPSCIC
jgi:drug/metabolite transporter (DMT)-like permease